VKAFFYLFAFLSFATPALSAELKQSRYIGWIELEDKKEKLAVVADFFLESPEDFTQFPRLNGAFRISLGGYNTHEYLTETFHDLKYDFDFGALTFDEEGNDLLMTTSVSSVGSRSKISGDVFIRSSALQGKLELLEESDEPGDDFKGVLPTATMPFSSLLEGQYEGVCNGKNAAFQIQTVRGLEGGNEKSTGLERHYGIAGRLVYKDGPLCGRLAPGLWCSRQHFRDGAYNIYSGRLTFESKQGAEECDLKDNELTCRLRSFTDTLECKFKKATTPKPAKFFSRGFYLDPTKEQLRALPDPAPPRNQGLSESLKGRFFGYLHNEVNDTYTPLRLDVIPFSSTENPHNPNQMMVSATASFFLGRDFTGPFVTQRFDPRSFYLRPGFVLSGPGSDSSLFVTGWKSGYISGTWISKAFGKVGSFQLTKGAAAPLHARAKAVRSFAGEFQGRLGAAQQWIRFLFPAQPNKSKEQIIPISGSYQNIVGDTPVRELEGGAFDPFTGRLGWRLTRDDAVTFGSGFIDEAGNAQLFWPSQPVVGTITRTFEYQKYQRKESIQ
jgi:hypothetical protein